VTYETRDSPTVIQPSAWSPYANNRLPLDLVGGAPPGWRYVAPPRPPGRRAREMMPGTEERFPVLVMAARIWPRASHLAEPLAARALFDERT
jgi:hypothetical protein